MVRNRMTLGGVIVSLCALSCGKEQPALERAPVASATLEAPAAQQGAAPFAVDTASSSFRFEMDSPLEKIDGEAPQSLKGELFVDPADLSKSTALLRADLLKLTLYQQKRADEKGEYGERKKSDLQNEHARDWLQIRAKEGEVTAEQAEQNRWAELKIDKLTDLSAADVTKLSGAERKITATAHGELRLHGRKAAKSAKIELSFRYAGDKLESLAVTTREPFVITLEEFEVHPRDAAGKLVKKLSDALASNLRGKVAADAPVEVSFVAQPR